MAIKQGKLVSSSYVRVEGAELAVHQHSEHTLLAASLPYQPKPVARHYKPCDQISFSANLQSF